MSIPSVIVKSFKLLDLYEVPINLIYGLTQHLTITFWCIIRAKLVEKILKILKLYLKNYSLFR